MPIGSRIESSVSLCPSPRRAAHVCRSLSRAPPVCMCSLTRRLQFPRRAAEHARSVTQVRAGDNDGPALSAGRKCPRVLWFSECACNRCGLVRAFVRELSAGGSTSYVLVGVFQKPRESAPRVGHRRTRSSAGTFISLVPDLPAPSTIIFSKVLDVD